MHTIKKLTCPTIMYRCINLDLSGSNYRTCMQHLTFQSACWPRGSKNECHFLREEAAPAAD